ncbi:pyridoxamine 5'-phosphate oxidase [Haliea sp.]|uniref:pyridoxamine 5'-phosphate oxidase n=1 Tax=Haliea TaxID=475794 RepID=UPI000C544BF5|nr:pyridoxamine 5'-phosphate oxidase [Haliea sp.]HBM85027.1 pyridoxamine 5'-phosphate oxidase [Halieaceae bacterium]MAY94090.1 pyridoxamine 5'-phosphate oxidase [Haliea sp.]MBK40163.1 pyridoxamine 5'-phosphate oxidase [Haliea sp.]MBP71893.1 pyridoxamine 5'-phosphate oxidase [Haliea sp.]HBX71492.1 pyridoxamine 5'-phosphate oxidase [Halieaceae bacterium]
MKYEEFRREYLAGGLRREMLAPCPVAQFDTWLQQAVESEITDPTAMVLATLDEDGGPWQRIVLLKDVATRGFVFYTNYSSAKAADISRHPQVSLLFPWNMLERQVIVAGRAERLSALESARYFLSRPRESQLAALASRQSRPVSARAVLESQMNTLRRKFAQGDIPVPDFWGGYRVVPERIEFWQGGAHRLHDRFRYYREGDGWRIERLQP